MIAEDQRTTGGRWFTRAVVLAAVMGLGACTDESAGPAPNAEAGGTTGDTGTPELPPSMCTGSTSDPAELGVRHANSYPTRVAQAPNGTLWVTDALVGSLFIYESDLRLVGELEGLDRPLGIAIGADGAVYVGNDGRDNVEVYCPGGNRAGVIGDGEILMPTDIALDDAGNVYVVDSLADVVKVYDAAGRWQQDIGGQGSSTGQLSFPSSVMVGDRPGGPELFVGDQGNVRVQVFDLDGAYLRDFGTAVEAFTMEWHGRFVKIQSLELDSQDRLHVLDSYLGRAQLLDPDSGAYLSAYGSKDLGAPEGQQMRAPLDFVLIEDEGRVVVTSAGRRRVEVAHGAP